MIINRWFMKREDCDSGPIRCECIWNRSIRASTRLSVMIMMLRRPAHLLPMARTLRVRKRFESVPPWQVSTTKSISRNMPTDSMCSNASACATPNSP
jgi:hypothetical protein